MNKIIFTILLITTLIIVGGCKSSIPTANTNTQVRFMSTGVEYEGGFGIVIDRETGVNYIFYELNPGMNSHSTAMSPLLDSNGIPVITKVK